MDFDKIRFFLTLAETLNYTKASEELYISQSMLSRYIKSIEDEMGIKLFTRNTHGVSITPAGSYLASGLKSISNEYDILLEHVHNAVNGYNGEIRIGITVGASLGETADLFMEYEKLHQNVRIVLQTIESPEDIYRYLQKGKIDFGLGIHIGQWYPKLASIELCDNDLFIVMSIHNPLSKFDDFTLSVADFKNETFITPMDNISNAYKELMIRCDKAGFAPKVMFAQNVISALLMVEMNKGVAFSHSHNLFREDKRLCFKRLKDTGTRSGFTLYWHPENREAKILEFLEYVRRKKETRRKI